MRKRFTIFAIFLIGAFSAAAFTAAYAQASHRGRAPIKKNPTTKKVIRQEFRNFKASHPDATDFGFSCVKLKKWDGWVDFYAVGEEGRNRRGNVISYWRLEYGFKLTVPHDGHVVASEHKEVAIGSYRKKTDALNGGDFCGDGSAKNVRPVPPGGGDF